LERTSWWRRAAQRRGANAPLARTQGCLSAIGITGIDSFPFPYDQLLFKAVDAVFCRSSGYSSWDRTISLIANGSLPGGEVVTHHLRLDEWELAFREMEAQRPLKVLLTPDFN